MHKLRLRHLACLVTVCAIAVAFDTSNAAAAGWSIQPAPSPTSSSSTQLVGVSCTSGPFCMAVGGYLAERWNGSKWSIQKLPPRTGAKQSELGSISCRSSRLCIAVGSYTNSSGAIFTLAERWDGSKWSIQATPNPAGAFGNILTSISCSSSSACTAVGSTKKNTIAGGGAAQVTHPLAERWNGTKWSLQKIEGPAGSELSGVSCPSSTACAGVGSYQDSGGNTVTLGERWNGTTWSVSSTQNPGGGIDDQLNAISCPATTLCTATGEYLQSGGGVVPLAERWNGSSWSVQSMPAPAGAVGNDLFGVSCASTKACTGVGFYLTRSGGSATLAESWNGTAWAVQKTANPTGFAQSELLGVSCTSSQACTAVGHKQKHSNTIVGQLPLVERHS